MEIEKDLNKIFFDPICLGVGFYWRLLGIHFSYKKLSLEIYGPISIEFELILAADYLVRFMNV